MPTFLLPNLNYENAAYRQRNNTWATNTLTVTPGIPPVAEFVGVGDAELDVLDDFGVTPAP